MITHCPSTLAEGFSTYSPAALESLISRSFLSEKTKKTYLAHYRERRNRLAI